ncbi:MAG: hypothetical protein KJ955_02290 [Nanoarchaeota archaeon]|nr:hypothetical protein [Nanoarchaeota archaeon]
MWYKKYGWKNNPFSVKWSTELVGFEKERELLFNYVSAGDMCIVVGEPGAGKTSLLRWLKRQMGLLQKGIYLNAESMSEEFNLKKHVGKPFIRKKILMLDEAHHCDEPFVKDMKALWDGNVLRSVAIAQIGNRMDYPDSFTNRVGGRIIRLAGMGEEEASQLIEMRTLGKNPFPENVVSLIVNDARNNPRKILENCEQLCINLEPGKITIDSAKSVLARKKANQLLDLQRPDDIKLPDNLMPIDDKKLSGFSPMQKRMVLLLLEGNRTAKQLAEILNTTEGSIGKQLSSLAEKQVTYIVNNRRPKLYGLTSEFKGGLN